MSVDGKAIQPIDRTFDPEHSYQYLVTGRGSPIAIRLNDTVHADNYGVLHIRIEPLGY